MGRMREFKKKLNYKKINSRRPEGLYHFKLHNTVKGTKPPLEIWDPKPKKKYVPLCLKTVNLKKDECREFAVLKERLNDLRTPKGRTT